LHDPSFKPGSRTPGVRACVGVSVAQPGEHDYLTLIRHADLACSLAREAEGVGVHIHNAEVDRQFKASRRNYLREQVGEALLHGRLSLMFQPIVSLRNSRSERYEVLLRLYDQEGRELLPESVFDVVEQHALGARLDGWVISQSLRMLEAPAQRDRPKTLFINLSPATLQSRAMRLWLRERLERAGVDRKQLVFEVSEETARRHLHQLRSFIADFADLGCGFSLERFGRRSDSLSLLERLDVNYVKLASHFVEDLKGQRADHVKGLLRKLVDRLSAREVTIIMVGIEEMAPLTALWSCGVDCVQGFFLQRPQEEMSYDFSGQSG
jgi:EAL domain-containing protein (putative c-di-GMP-specific phosphodiesterase class I)